MTGRAEIVATSPAVLAPGAGIERKPRAPWRKRPDAFTAGFDRLTLFYDCFRHADGERVLLVGPPLRNLRQLVERAEFQVDGIRMHLMPEIHASISVTILVLSGVPAEARTLTLDIGTERFSLVIQPSYAERLAGKRLLFTMNLNNAAEWLTAWADYHQRFHGVDALVLFDNGSTNLSLAEIGAALGKSDVPDIFVVPWKHLYGPYDTKVLFSPYWARFAQISAMSLALRRFGARAAGILNCDIDELVHTETAPDIFAELDRTSGGLLVLYGRWIEAFRENKDFANHRDYRYRLKDEKARHCRQRKWALDPRRSWVEDLDIHPYMHWIENRPRGVKTMPSRAFYWHFKGINTNWKMARNVPSETDAGAIESDPDLVEIFSRWNAD